MPADDPNNKLSSAEAAETAKRRQQAGVEVLKMFEPHVPTTFESHPETILYAGAWLAGTSLYRSFGYQHDVAPGTFVLSEKANKEWPVLMNTFVFLLDRFGIKINPGELDFKIPSERQSKRTILQVQEKLQEPYNAIMQKYGFDYRDGAITGVFVCSILFRFHCEMNKQLDRKLAAAIVAMGFQEGAKTCPMPLKSES
jgi:hypothetical protein